MPIFTGSRYDSSPLIIDTRSDGSQRTFVGPRVEVDQDDLPNNCVIYELHETERLDFVSYKACGKTVNWWIISDVNDIDDFFDTQNEVNLIIPPAEFFTETGM